MFVSFDVFFSYISKTIMIGDMKKKSGDLAIYSTLLLFCVCFIIIGVNYFFASEKSKIKEAKKVELSSIATLKINQISDWYIDEISDASIIVGDRQLNLLITEWISDKSVSKDNEMVDMLSQLANEHGYYSISVLSTDFSKEIASSLSNDHINEITRETSVAVVSSKILTTTDIFLCPTDSAIFIDFVAPVLNDDNSVIAVVVFRHDPKKFLYPLVENWPVQSRTAETLLVKKDKETVVFINSLRHSPNTALKLKLPFSMKELPAVKAATGNKGFTEGVDYRGEKVFAYLDSIPGTPWFMVTKIDSSELYDNFLFRAATPLIFSVIGIALLLMFFYVFYSRQQKNFYKRHYNSLQEFKTTLYSIGDAVITTNNDGIIKRMNPVAEKLTGWIENEAQGKKIDDVFIIVNEETRNAVENPVAKVIEKGVIVGLANHTVLIAKEGNEIPISDSGAPIFDVEGKITGVVLVFRDQTEERNQQRLILEAQRKLTTLLSNLPGMAYRCLNDQDWTMEFVSKGCEGLTGYSSWELEENQIVSYGNVIFPDDRGYVWDIVEEALDKKETFQLEYRIQTKQGKVSWVWERGMGIFNPDGRLEAIEGFITDITERKKTEIALYESEEIFKQFMEHSPIYLFFKDDKIRAINLSRNYEQMLGKPLEELIGKNMFELFPSELARKMVDEDLDVLAKGDVFTTFENFNGRNYFTIKFPVQIGDHKTYLAGYSMDITERIQMEDALRESEKLFQTLAENASVGIFRTDSEGKTIYVNQAWCELSGVGQNEALGEGWIHYVHPDDVKSLTDGWHEAFSHQTESSAEYRFVHNDGKTVWVKGKAVPEFDEKGVLIGYIGTIADITEIMTSTETIQRANTLLRTIIDNIPDAIYMKDIDGKKIIANKADILNCGANSEEELIGKTDFDFFTEDIASKLWEDDLQVLKSGIPVIQREDKLSTLKGDEKWVSTSKIPFKDKRKKIIGLVGIGHDITERKQILCELIEAKEKAEESDKLKSAFLANMSHEIRTPLNSILGFSNFLTSDYELSLDEKTEYSDIINKSADSLLQIINDIIDISSLETGQLKTFIKPISANQVLRSLHLVFSRKLVEINKSHIILELLVDEEITILADENRFIQILTNLANNAMKFTSKGTISFGIESHDVSMVVFVVSDTGIGISPEMHDSIFERFRQVENDKSRTFGGNGLGLAIVKNLVELMGGCISIESEVGKGSTFRFTLPKA
jgi:PAS domain S-box-containing protein